MPDAAHRQHSPESRPQTALFRGIRWAAVKVRSLAAKLGYPERFNYPRWLAKHEGVDPAAPPAREPLISILVEVREPCREWLDAAVASVIRQSYGRWQLIICAREKPPVLPTSDPRICICVAPETADAELLRTAAARATGDFLTVLGQDDALAENALAWITSALPENCVVLYADEDLIDPAGRPIAPVFKPGWSPDLLAGGMYLGRPFVVSRDAFGRSGGFRPEYDGAQEYDLALRLAEQPGMSFTHLPRVSYHRRQTVQVSRPGLDPGCRALNDAVRRRGIQATVAAGPKPATYSLERQPFTGMSASIIVCSRKPALLSQCLDRLRRNTAYTPREIIAVQHGFEDSSGDRRIQWTGPFDFPAMNNAAAREAKGDVLVFLNDDVRPLAADWLSALVAQVERPEVGIAGALLEYPDGTIQHAGVVMGIAGAAAHPVRGLFDSPLWPWMRVTRNVSAVTGACLAIRREVFEKLGGFDPAFPVNYNDVDLCLRARQAGYEVILETRARLVHDESRTRSGRTSPEERRALRERWRDVIENGDPYYSPHLARSWETPRLNWGE